MKKTDLIIALTLGILASAVAIWLAQPQWYTDLADDIREWREPRRPSMNRYAERDRMLREEQEANDQRERISSSEADTRDIQDATARTITFAVVDAATNQPVTAFRYRRSFKAKRPDDPPQDIPWNTVSNNLGTFELTAERTYEPIERPRDQTAAQTEIWKSVIEDEMRKRWARSDTLEVVAEGYSQASVRLFDLLNDERGERTLHQTVWLQPLDISSADPEKDAALLRQLESQMADAKMAELQGQRVRAQRLETRPEVKSGLRGTITFGGKPPYAGIVVVTNVLTPGSTEIELSPDGSYEFKELQPGTANIGLRASEDGQVWREHRESVALGEQAVTTFDFDFKKHGSLTGTVTGLAEGEAGGIFAIKGDYELTNVTEDDLYDFGDICDGEARPNKEGVFTIRELEEGKYTIIAIAERHVIGEASSFLYVTDTVEIKAGEEASIALSLN